MSHRITLSEPLRALLLDPNGVPASIQIKDRLYTVEAPVAAGFKGAVWRVRDEFSRLRAIKLAIYEDYEARSYLEEVSRTSALESYKDSFATFYDAGLTEVALEGQPNQVFVCFVEEWIEGVTLEKFLCSTDSNVTVGFLLAYVRALCSALNALYNESLRHDDLHAGNVMVVPPPQGSLSSEWSFKVIDTGSMKPLQLESKKPKDDHRHFVDHLLAIWNHIRKTRFLSIRDRRFLAEVSGLIDSMLDEDYSVALRDPARILDLFTSAYTRSNSSRQQTKPRLSSPFDFISAEHIADDRLLVSIFARSCPWLEKVAGPDPCLVTGPRGCGKSTIFRWLSLKAHLHKPTDELRAHLDSFQVSGFYLSCSSDLQNRLGWISTEALAERLRREIVHYFNLLISREVVHTLALLTERSDRESFWRFGKQNERRVYQFIVDTLQLSIRRFRGVPLLVQAREAIEALLFSTHSQMLRGVTPPHLTSEAFLGDLTTLLTAEIPLLRDRKIAFLLDDFSLHRLPESVQKILNRVIWERRSTHVFKLSSEKYGAILTDSEGAPIDVTREMKEIDCGREYINQDEMEGGKALQFAEELLNNRLQACGYQGTAKTIIGDSYWPEGSLGQALVGASSGKYHGLRCVSHLCSGDVSSLLFIYSKIFEAGNVQKETETRVREFIQDKAIRDVSRKMFEAIRPAFPYGPEMYTVVASFGNLVRNILDKGKWQKGGYPTQCPRLEIDQKAGAIVDNLASTQKELALELIRRAYFIEMEPGLSRHGNITTLRWNLRRIYLPAFGAALTKNDAVKQNTDWFKFLLTNPKEACDMVWTKWPKGGIASDSLPFA